MNNISLQEAKKLFEDFRYIVGAFGQIQTIGIHGSLTVKENQYSKDADYIIMLKDVTEPIGSDEKANKVIIKIFSAICSTLNATIRNTYVCENLNLIGHSLLIKENKKLSFHFVSLDFCEKSIKSLVHPDPKIDCIFSTELFPTRVYRLWVRDTIALFDKKGCLKKMQNLDIDNYHWLIMPYIMEHLTSSINQYSGCLDKTARYLLKHSIINAGVLLVYLLNHDFFGSPKKILMDLNSFIIEKDTNQIIKQLLQQPDSDDLFREFIISCNKIITKIQNGGLEI